MAVSKLRGKSRFVRSGLTPCACRPAGCGRNGGAAVLMATCSPRRSIPPSSAMGSSAASTASTVPAPHLRFGVSAACCRAAAAGWAFDAGAPAPVMIRSRCAGSTRAWLRPPRFGRPRRVGRGEDAASGAHPWCALPVPVGARRRGRFVEGLPERRPCDRPSGAPAPRSSSRWCADAGSMRSPCGRTPRMTRAGVCGDIERSRWVRGVSLDGVSVTAGRAAHGPGPVGPISLGVLVLERVGEDLQADNLGVGQEHTAQTIIVETRIHAASGTPVVNHHGRGPVGVERNGPTRTESEPAHRGASTTSRPDLRPRGVHATIEFTVQLLQSAPPVAFCESPGLVEKRLNSPAFALQVATPRMGGLGASDFASNHTGATGYGRRRRLACFVLAHWRGNGYGNPCSSESRGTALQRAPNAATDRPQRNGRTDTHARNETREPRQRPHGVRPAAGRPARNEFTFSVSGGFPAQDWLASRTPPRLLLPCPRAGAAARRARPLRRRAGGRGLVVGVRGGSVGARRRGGVPTRPSLQRGGGRRGAGGVQGNSGQDQRYRASPREARQGAGRPGL